MIRIADRVAGWSRWCLSDRELLRFAAAADVNPDDSAIVVATAVLAIRDSAQFAASLGLLGAVLFGIFVARLYGALRLHTVSRSWVPVMSLIGGILVINAVVTEIGLAYAVSEFTFGDEGQLARFFVLWSWNSASIYAPGFALMMVGGTAVEPSGRLFPDWFRPLSWALFGFRVHGSGASTRARCSASGALGRNRLNLADLPHRHPCALTRSGHSQMIEGNTASQERLRSSIRDSKLTNHASDHDGPCPKARASRTQRHSTDTRG